MRRSVWVMLALLSTLLVPSRAYASDIDYLGSFSSGFQALTGNGSNADVTPERDFIESYEPEYVPLETESTLLAAPEEVEEPTLLDQIRAFISRGFIVSVGGNQWQLFFWPPLRWLLVLVAPTAVVFVFMWWGVRKAKSMIMVAFRKGKVTT